MADKQYNDLLKRLLKAIDNIHEMLQYRGYEIGYSNEGENENDVCETEQIRDLDELEEKVGMLDQDSLNSITIRKYRPATKDWIVVFFVRDKITNDLLNYHINTFMKPKNIYRAIFVNINLSDKVADPKLINSPQPEYILEYFNVNYLQFDPSKHELVPLHKIRFDKHADECKGFPLITLGDVMSRWLGLLEGDVIEIERPSETSGQYEYFRICQKHPLAK